MSADIKLFIKKISIFIFPFFIASLIVFSMDPFRVWFNYEDFYKGNFVTLNRELVCLKLFERNRVSINYNSFIFGSSRSQAFKIKEWEKYLGKDDKGFHFDASGEGIYGIYNKLRFLDENGTKIKNTLILFDYDTLITTKNRDGYLFISPPELSKEKSYKFYKEFFIANISPIFMIGYLDYKLFHKYRDYMSSLFNKSKYDSISDNITGDLFYGYDKMIQENKELYYKELIDKGVFERKEAKKYKEISDAEKELLEKIFNLLNKNGVNYKIVISPVYDQIPLDKERLDFINNLFGTNNVYNFSGKNEFTDSIYNYYEDSHYRPHVANEIMQRIYK